MPKLVKAQATERHVRVLLFGKGGVGKTHLGLSGPGAKLFSSEGRYDNFLGQFEFDVVEYDENRIVAEYEAALTAAMRGDYGPGTFITDSWTVLEKALRAEQNYSTDDANAMNRRTALGQRRENIEDELLNNLRGTTKTHLIFTAHEANQFGEGAENNKVVGKKPDGTRNLEHYVDLVVHITLEPIPGRPNSPGKRVARILKSAFQDIHPTGKIIEYPTWDNLIAPLTIVTPKGATAPTPAAQAPAPAASATQPPSAAAPIAHDVTVYTEEAPPKTGLLMQMWERALKPDGSFIDWCEHELIDIGEKDGKKVLSRASQWKAYQRLEAILRDIAQKLGTEVAA